MYMAWPHSSFTASQHSIFALSAELEYPLQSATWRSVWPFCRTVPRYRLWAQRSSRGAQYGGYDYALTPRRASIGSTYNSGEDTATTPASSEVCERPNLGLLASLLLTQTRGKCSPIQDLSLSHGKMLCQVHHTFQSVQGDLWRCTHTIEVKSGYKCFRGVLFRERDRERGRFFYWASRNLRFFLNCKQIMPPRENRQLYQNSLKRNIIRDCFLKNRRSFCCL